MFSKQTLLNNTHNPLRSTDMTKQSIKVTKDRKNSCKFQQQQTFNTLNAFFYTAMLYFCDFPVLTGAERGTKLANDLADRSFIAAHNRAYLYSSRRFLQRHQHVSVCSTRLISLTQLNQTNFTGQTNKMTLVLSLQFENREMRYLCKGFHGILRDVKQRSAYRRSLVHRSRGIDNKNKYYHVRGTTLIH